MFFVGKGSKTAPVAPYTNPSDAGGGAAAKGGAAGKGTAPASEESAAADAPVASLASVQQDEQAETLARAAESGVPFCAECERLKREKASSGRPA